MKDLRMHPARSSPRAAPLLAGILWACALTLGAVFFLWQRHQFIRLGFEVSNLRQQRENLQEQIEPLELEVVYLSRLERVEALAIHRLGLAPPQLQQVRILKPE